MTLNGVIAFILRYFAEFIALQADYIIVVEDSFRKISSPSYIWPKLTHPAVRSLCDS